MGCAGDQRSHGIRDDPVGRPVASADDVPGANGGDRGAVREEALAVGRGDQLGSGLAGAVRVAAAQRVSLDEGPAGLGILVGLVARHDDDRADRRASACGLEDVDRAHDVGLEGIARLLVRASDERPGGQVEDHRRLRCLHLRRQPVEIADIGDDVPDARAEVERVEQVRLRRRIERVARDVGAETPEPRCEPCALEPRVAGDQDTSGSVAVFEQRHLVHQDEWDIGPEKASRRGGDGRLADRRSDQDRCLQLARHLAEP